MTNQNTNEFEITPEDLNNSLEKNEPMLLFDLRLQDMYKEGHINGSVHAVCDTRTKDTLMPKIPKNVKLVLIDEDGKMSAETVAMMRSFGLDAYYLKGGMKNWTNELVKGSPPTAISPKELSKKLQDPNVYLLDVRDPDEFSDYNIPGSINIPLSEYLILEAFQKFLKIKRLLQFVHIVTWQLLQHLHLQETELNHVFLKMGLQGGVKFSMQ